VALAETDGPEVGLRAIDGLQLEEYPYLHSTRADFLRRLGRDEEARSAYRRAIELSRAEPEVRFLSSRLADLESAK
jgi:RNA polymerase sigma-70 factor (ECF subfamily)